MASEIQFEGKELDARTRQAIVDNVLVEGARPLTWWTRQANNLHDSFMREMRTSLENGESVAQAATRITGGTIGGIEVDGIIDTSKSHAKTLARTTLNKVTNEARLRSFEANDDIIKAFKQISTLDNRTSDICIAYDGQVWENKPPYNPIPPSTLPFNGGPPRHFNCRSTLVPVLKSWQELGIPADELSPSTRASMDGQVPADTTFDAFLRGKTKTFQDKLLGPARAQLWRDGQITLTQLVDMRGNPLSVEQLLATIEANQAAGRGATAGVTAVSAASAPAPTPPARQVVPEFKNNREAEQYYNDHMLREPENFGLGWSKSYDRRGLQIAAQVTTDMRSRYGMAMPMYQGMRNKHPKFRFRGRSALASVHMESDSLMFGTRGVSVKKSQESLDKTKSKRYQDWRNEKTLARMSDRERKQVNDWLIANAAKYPDDKSLQVAVRKAKEVGNEWTVGDFTWKDGQESIWGTFVHESGHRFHARHRQEIDQAIATGFKDGEHKYIWQRQTSEYGATNNAEFVAEQFVHYNRGDTDRVWPPLKRIFKKYDKGAPNG